MKEIIGRTGNEWARDRLFARVAAASLGAIVGTIGVHFNLYVGLLENTFLRQAEFEVFDGKAAAEPLVFIIGVYAQDAAHGRVGLCIERMIEVGCLEKHGQTVRANDEVGVGEEEVGISLQMYDAIIDQELAIAVEEEGGGEAFGDLLHLRVGEGEPNLCHFAWGEEIVDELDVRAEEPDVGQSITECFSGSAPHSSSLDIHTDEIHVGEHTAESDAVFSASATQFKNDGAIVMKKIAVPFAIQGVALRGGSLEGGFDDVAIGSHVGKL